MIEISIIVPCYNVERYVGRCIESIVNQTIGIDKIQIILVDDASTDGTLNILKEYERMYSENILVIECKTNGRQGTARNIGLEYAEGKYIGFVDSDDWIEPCMYEHLYNKAIKYDTDVVFCRHTRDAQFCINKQISNGKEDCGIYVKNIDDRRKFFVSDIIGVGVWDKLYKKNLIFENDIYFPEKVAYEDIVFGAMIYLYAEKIYILEEYLYHYFVNENSTVLKKNQEYGDDLEKVNLIKLNQYVDRGFYEMMTEEIEFDFLCTYYLAVFKQMSLHYDEFPVERFKNVINKIKQIFPNVTGNRYIRGMLDEINQTLVRIIDVDICDNDLIEIVKEYRKTKLVI